MTNIDTSNISSLKELDLIDQMIVLETKRKIMLVKGSEEWGIMTACWVDGEFKVCASYDVPSDMKENLKNA